MDMQNVVNLAIPEGEVKTIHDKDGRLLWGRVFYNTKYMGDILQDGTPTPDNPVDVQVVSGVQTVGVSDGVDNHNYIINLGSIELCKIDMYQDYIYRNGSDWYIHKETSKIVLDGTEEWFYLPNSNPFYYQKQQHNIGQQTTNGKLVASNFFLPNSKWNEKSVGIWFDNNLIIKTEDSLDGTGNTTTFKTWLSTHNTTVYYVLKTPTDTKIANTSLINQLNSIHQFLTRYGYNATVSGNLPLIVDRTNL